jgi:hypothetical protein
VAGFKGSGKDTIGNILIKNHSFTKDSFAAPLKDALACIFCWDRELLEGNTPESREWRETVDLWWSTKLGISNFTPRWAMQHIGTDLFRRLFNNDIWLLSLERRFISTNNFIVVTDCRFQNELALVRRLGGLLIQVNRGAEPSWWDIAVEANIQDAGSAVEYLEKVLGVHASEYSWIGFDFDLIVENNASIDDLQFTIKRAIDSLES